MDPDNDWSDVLSGHPIFSLPEVFTGPSPRAEVSLELSSNTLPSFTQLDPTEDGPAPSGRRQVMVLKDADLIVAAGREIRMTSLGDAKLSRSTRKTYKTLHTPNIQFEIHQISLNPSGKLLAVAGAFQVAVIVLPRPGFARLVPDTIDCKSVQVGQFYHASNAAAPIAKIEWHPWGEAGSTLMVMTTDGKLREYDISVDTEEPQQVLAFIPEKKANSFLAADASEREVASFTLGKGRADWGPLTIYAVTKSGDVYAICPYMPQNASIPSSYIHSLECFISAKQEFLAQGTSAAAKNLSTLYDYQRKYVSALLKQLPPGTVFPAASRPILIHPPTTIKAPPARQGPFLLQPSPRTLEGSEGGDATDMSYLAFDPEDDGGEGDGGETEHLGVVMIAFQDGKVDVCLDVEKVEARWDVKATNRDLPMLAVYETIDLGLVSTLSEITASEEEPSPLDLLQANHPAFLTDPIHADAIYVYHAFGVHALNISPVLQSLAIALRTDDESGGMSLDSALQQSAGTTVQPILTTLSVERKCSNPVIGVAIPNDVYLTYSIFILTSAMRIISFPLSLRTEPARPPPTQVLPPAKDSAQISQKSYWLTPPEGPPAYVSLLQNNPYIPGPASSRPSGLPKLPQLSLPQSTKGTEFMLTPDTLRYLGTTGRELAAQCTDIRLAVKAADERVMLQQEELTRMASKCREMQTLVEQLKGPKREASEARFKNIQAEQKALLGRMDRLLQSLMERASPELSEHETKWFEELKRMKGEITGISKYDEGSLVARTRLLEREYARLMPALKELTEKEKRRKEKLAESTQGLGFSQAFEFGERSNLERLRIAEVEQQISDLAAKMDVALGRPPSAQ
ncbi:putative nuclear pore component [Lyophyllum shimeji]|uniref:Nuclear pore component n=1 Tax=Lyophyllum shimeji TaxID=47721 RepID=A0A9P3PCQ6_LYOSH|nr:putative nuclear pore component [Lyophyllum shimeji]